MSIIANRYPEPSPRELLIGSVTVEIDDAVNGEDITSSDLARRIVELIESQYAEVFTAEHPDEN